MRLLPLTALRAFEAAARHESFTLAAQELYVTTGAVSRQVRLLESHFGLPLFARVHRKVTLTPAGRRYLDAVRNAFAALADAGAALEREARHVHLVIDCIPTLAMYWLTPRLARYRGEHPDISIDITTGLGPVDLAAPVDLAIRRDPGHFSGMAGVPFMIEWSTPVCSRDFADRHDLSTVDAMLRAPAIGIRAREDLWPTWAGQYACSAPAPAGRFTLDHTFAALQAAEDGLGVVVVPVIFASKLLASGRLVLPFPEMLAESGSYYVLTRPAHASDAVADLKAWLLEQGALEDQAINNRPDNPS